MKKLFTLIAFTALALNLNAQTPQASSVPLADPYILVENGTYYAYGTHSRDGIECWKSNDMHTWECVGIALHKDNTTEDHSYWAPEVYHKNGHYIMYYSANEHLYAAVSDNPTTGFKQAGGYMMKDVIGDEKCIDSSCFFDTDGKAYIFFVRFTAGNAIWMCELENDYITPKPETLRHCFDATLPWELDLGRVNEGPFVLKQGDRYYVTYSGNDYRSQDYGVSYAFTTASLSDPKAVWVKRSAPILQRIENLVGTGHHSFFTDLDGNFRIVFHAHKSATEVHPRGMYIGKMQWKNGMPAVVTSEPIIRPVTK